MKAKHAPKDGLSRFENLNSQPHVEHKVFNNPNIVTDGWYPVCPSHKIKNGDVNSFKILKQRVVIFRTESGSIVALDAFCPHLGADLGNGRVKGENIQCYFHQWEFNKNGKLQKVPCLKELDSSLEKVGNRSYPVKELYGHIWVNSSMDEAHDLILPSDLEGKETTAWFFREVTLFAHHHVMMANGVDLQHFATVHDLDIKFDYNVAELSDSLFTWKLKGKIPKDTIKGKIANFFLGEDFEYHIKFSGASTIAISYGIGAKFLGMKIPALNVLWGCLPQESGISKVRIFFVTELRKSLLGKLKSIFAYFFTMLLLWMLQDEDIEAFPNMRFNSHKLISADNSLGRFIQLINKTPLSDWGTND
jgi:phenylpropionate dioxygenase-like ring-hydroxylating dioxygenase large terminal subunit